MRRNKIGQCLQKRDLYENAGWVPSSLSSPCLLHLEERMMDRGARVEMNKTRTQSYNHTAERRCRDSCPYVQGPSAMQ